MLQLHRFCPAKCFGKHFLFNEPIEFTTPPHSRVTLHLRCPVRVFVHSPIDDVSVIEEEVSTKTTSFPATSSSLHYRLEPLEPVQNSCVVTTYLRDGGEERLISEGFKYEYSIASHCFMRTVDELLPDLSRVSEVLLAGSIPFGLVEELPKHENVRKLNVETSVRCGHRRIPHEEIHELVRRMPWLDQIDIFNSKWEPHVFDVFDGIPKSVKLSGNIKMGGVATEHWARVEKLELLLYFPPPSVTVTIGTGGGGGSVHGFVPDNDFFRHCTSLRRLTYNNESARRWRRLVTLPPTVTDLTIQDVGKLDRQMCVDLGRLLRRNQLQRLNLCRVETVKKNDFLYVLLPLLEGSNTSLEEFHVDRVPLSMHTMYMFEDIIHFCPTIQKITGLLAVDHTGHLQRAAERRNAYAAVKNPIYNLLKSTRSQSVTARALEIVISEVRMFMPTYRRRNRKWHIVSDKELVATPLEFV